MRPALAAAALLLLACGAPAATHAVPPPAAALQPSSAPATPTQPSFAPVIPQSIQLAGALNASVGAAAVGSPCGRIGDNYGLTMRFTVSGTEYAADIVATGYTGPRDYAVPPVRASIHTLTIGPGAVLYAGVSGWIRPSPDERGGSLDIVLQGQPGQVHATGSWRCPD